MVDGKGAEKDLDTIKIYHLLSTFNTVIAKRSFFLFLGMHLSVIVYQTVIIMAMLIFLEKQYLVSYVD